MLTKRKQISNNRLSKNNRGVTLIEVIAVIAVLSVVSAAVMGFMLTGAKMSAQVSGTAGDSIKEQTAVEFINKTILKYEPGVLGVDDDGYLKITLSEQAVAYIMTQNDTVVYVMIMKTPDENIDRVTELCPGTISFQLSEETDTVTYELNGEKHVVLLRIASQTDAPDVGGNT